MLVNSWLVSVQPLRNLDAVMFDLNYLFHAFAQPH